MLKYGTRFVKDTTRPFVRIGAFGGASVLIDTGADISMWIGTIKSLSMLNAEDTGFAMEYNSPAGSSNGKIYMLYNIKIGDFLYKKFPILFRCEPSNLGYLVLASSVLYNTKCMFDFSSRIFGMQSEKQECTVLIKKEDWAMEFTTADAINTTIVYKYHTIDFPVDYKNMSLQTLIESVQSRIKFIEDTYQTTVKVQCDFATKRKLLEVIPYTYFYDK